MKTVHSIGSITKAFYSAIRSALTEGFGDTMDCSVGGAIFRLQNYYVKDWGSNFMMKFDVDDADFWHLHVNRVLDDNTYGHAKVTEPEMIGNTKIMHVWGPSGVLLIFLR